MAYGVLLINFVIIFLITIGMFYPVVGIVFTTLSVIASLLLYNTTFGFFLIDVLVKKKGMHELETDGRKVLLSAGFIGLALRLSALYGIFIFCGGVVLMFIAIVIAFGLLFEGKMKDFINAFYLAKIIVKVAIFLNTWTDPILKYIIKIEFEQLGIKTI